MNKFIFPKVPDNYELEKAFLSTFDLDENLLTKLISKKDSDKYLIVRGDGEYIPLEKSHPIKDRIINVLFETTNKKMANNKNQSVKYHHAKIWFFIYKNDEGNKLSKLIIQSKNLYPYDTVEVELSFAGKKVKDKQDKNKPLEEYFSALLPFIDDSKKEFIASLIEEISTFSFSFENDEYKVDDFEFITPCCKDISLFEEFDEMLILSPFIKVDTINSLFKKKKEGGRCIVLTQAKINEALIISEVKDIQLLSPNISEKFVHAKLFLVRKNDSWDIYAGSMNLTDYALENNIEAMVHLTNVKGIKNIESFLADFLDVDESVIKQNLTQNTAKTPYFDENTSKIFIDAYDINTRIQYIKKLAQNKKHNEEQMNKISSYLLSYKCAQDLVELASMKRDIIPIRTEVIRHKKKRYVYKLGFEENILLGLINYSLHKYDYLFSENVFLHIADRGINNAFIKIHETKGVKDFYFYKTDISNFDPSMNKEVLCSQIDKLLHFDKHLSDFLKKIVNEDRYYISNDDKVHRDDIIHQTGLPLAGFFENVYLYDFDLKMDKLPLYLRGGDDILIGSKNKAEVENMAKLTYEALTNKKLTLSKEKTNIYGPKDRFDYLGWEICNGQIDFTDDRLRHIKQTIKDKTKSLLIMYSKNKVPNALRLFSLIKFVNHYQKSDFIVDSFEKITVVDKLKLIDNMIIDLIRTVISGKTGNTKYKIKYESIRAFGYKSLVNQYYEYIAKK